MISISTKPEDKLSEKVQELVFDKILSRPENLSCADCSAKGPRWVSLDFGVFVCMRCSGAHRALTPVYTKVRSVKLDIWTKDMVEIMDKIGNKLANDYFEYKMIKGYRKPDGSSSQLELERFIHDKYVKRIFSPSNYFDPVMEYLENKKNNFEKKVEKVKDIKEEKQINAKHNNNIPKPPPQKQTELIEFIDEFDDFQGGNMYGDEEFTEYHTPGQKTITLEKDEKILSQNNIMNLYKNVDKPIEPAKKLDQAFSQLNNNNNMFGFPGNNFPMNSHNQNQYNYGFNISALHVSNINAPQQTGNHVAPHHVSINNNGNEKKVKNGGDIMALYNNNNNNKKVDTALNGNEMQMNKNGKQENIMGFYSGNNFNVW